MATLTAEQITDLRMVIGDHVEPYRLSDDVVQAQYSEATANAPVASLVLPYSYVYCLRRLWGLSRLEVDRTNELSGDRVLHSQIEDTTKILLDYWEGRAGLSGKGIITVGTINLGIDEDET